MLWFMYLLVFVIGILNVCAFRLPYERSIIWPGSHCGACFQPIRWYDNIPLVSYWVLGGRCRSCGSSYSMRYFFLELGTGLAFVALFYLEVERNVRAVPLLAARHEEIMEGIIPTAAWWMFGFHAVLLSFLIVAGVCDFEHYEIPFSLTMTGLVVGLIGSACFPWTYPGADVPAAHAPIMVPFGPPLANPPPLPAGLYSWPVWFPLPTWLPPNSWQLGLATGLAGALAGMGALRGVRFLFGLGRGMEVLGIGDADLMMMAGAFIGWQPILMAFAAGVFPALVFGLIHLMRSGDQALPFGPSLSVGVLIALLAWPALGDFGKIVFFSGGWLAILVGFFGFALLVTGFLLRLLRGVPPVEPGPTNG
jgi:leader peptidase (prepilin peptidase)/N-methyltransferase